MVLDADLALYGQFHTVNNPPKGLGAAFYSNPEYDKAIEASRMEQDTKKRLELLKKAEEIVWDDCPWIWLHTEKFLIAYRSNIKGMVVTSWETFYPTYVTKK
jgi:peptide/nickel transport system substrate-binding protein